MNALIESSIRAALIVLLAGGTSILAQPISTPITFVQASNAACKVGRANVKPGEIVTWQGECATGLAQGSGAAQWFLDGTPTLRFEGTFVRGLLEGKGKMIGADGDRFEGEYKEGLRHGFGVYLSANGTRFEGEYRDNQRASAGLVAPESAQPQAAQASGPSATVPSSSPPMAQGGAWPTAAQEQQQRQEQFAQRRVQEQERRDQYAQQRTQEQQRRGQEAQQRAQEQQRRQLLAQQTLQENQLQQQVAQQKMAEDQRQQRLAQQLAYQQKRQQESFLLWTLLALPLILGAVVAGFRSNGAVSQSNKVGEWLDQRYAKAKQKSGFFVDFVLRPILWCFRKLFDLTSAIENQFVKAGVRIAFWLYLAGVVAFLAYWVTAIVLAIAIIAAILAVMNVLFGQNDSRSVSGSSRESSSSGDSSNDYLGVSGESRQREGFLGAYVEHRDVDGKIVGESRHREGFLEEYVERRDADGKVVVESRAREGFLGPYVEHRDTDGRVIGESRDREGFLGPYVEHRDADDKIVGDSRQREGFLGPYTENKKSE